MTYSVCEENESSFLPFSFESMIFLFFNFCLARAAQRLFQGRRTRGAQPLLCRARADAGATMGKAPWLGRHGQSPVVGIIFLQCREPRPSRRSGRVSTAGCVSRPRCQGRVALSHLCPTWKDDGSGKGGNCIWMRQKLLRKLWACMKERRDVPEGTFQGEGLC